MLRNSKTWIQKVSKIELETNQTSQLFYFYSLFYVDVLIKPILTKQFSNQTVSPGQNATFTCETQIDALPVFIFYKLDQGIVSKYLNAATNVNSNILDKYAHSLQDEVL